jgi:hypothetical protein
MNARGSDLAMAERHVVEGEARIERQRQIILKMDQDHHPAAAAMARVLLKTLCQTLENMRTHLALIRKHGL